MGLEPLFRLDWKDSSSHLEIERASFAIGSLPTSWHSGDSHRDSYSPCGIGRRSGLPWARLIPRVGMMTTTGPLGTAPARQPTGGSQGHRQPSGGAFSTGGGTGSRQGSRIAR
uniref:Uncharacterized protein n=1 Tax=Ananas comosus var. bracteatus TaxID=296719 RepID=A0A6V7PGW1_ANACO|nr:unnamed protein product [Ananas comosus var. bracteatus]